MRSGYISLTTRCSHRCLCCPCRRESGAKGADLPVGEVFRTVDEGIGNGVSEMVLSGGEPTLHRDFLQIAGELARRGLRIGLLTTAERFSDHVFLGQVLSVVPARQLRVMSALHSFSPGVHDEITRTPGSQQRTLAGLRRLCEAGVSITVKHLITAPTVHALPYFAQAFLETFPPEVRLLFCHIDYQGEAYRNRDRLAVPFSESRACLETALDRVLEAARKAGTWSAEARVRVRDTPLCATDSRYWPFFRSQASLKLAVYNDPKIAEEGNGPRCEVANSSGPFFFECAECAARPHCPGTWQSAESVLRPDFLAGPIERIENSKATPATQHT